MRRAGIIVVVLLLLAAAALVAGIAGYLVSEGFSARTEPSKAEAFVARRLRVLAIPGRARQLRNPISGSPEVRSRAMAHFADHCASCHGNDGRGGTLIGRGLYPKPPDMTAPPTQELSDGELYYIIENGVRFTGMPAFGEEPGNDNDQESWDLVYFIRQLPGLTADEMEKMKQMNPKSPSELAREEEIRKFLQGDDSGPSPAENVHEHHH